MLIFCSLLALTYIIACVAVHAQMKYVYFPDTPSRTLMSTFLMTSYRSGFEYHSILHSESVLIIRFSRWVVLPQYEKSSFFARLVLIFSWSLWSEVFYCWSSAMSPVLWICAIDRFFTSSAGLRPVVHLHFQSLNSMLGMTFFAHSWGLQRRKPWERRFRLRFHIDLSKKKCRL